MDMTFEEILHELELDTLEEDQVMPLVYQDIVTALELCQTLEDVKEVIKLIKRMDHWCE